MSRGVPKRIDGIVVKHDGGALAVSSPLDGTILLTNQVGGRILGLADGTRTIETICDALAEEFRRTDRLELHHDVVRFLAAGEKKGLVSFSRGPARDVGPDSQQAPGLPIVSAASAQSSQSRADESRETERKFHPSVYWYLTFRCNLACAHCSVLSSPAVDTSTDLKTDECLQVVEQLAEMNVSTVILSGGEVLIRPDALVILRGLADQNIFAGVETNGLKVDTAFAQLAADMQSRRLLSIAVSLDGGTADAHAILRGPNAFERTLRGMRRLHEYSVKFDIQCVLHRENYSTIPDLYDLALELEPERLIWAPLHASGRGGDLMRRIGLRAEDTIEILDLIDRHKSRFPGINAIKLPPAMVPLRHLLQVFRGKDVGCSTSCQFPLLAVLPSGDVTVCAVSRGDESLRFGNVRTIRLKTAWEKARMDLLRTRYVAAADLQGICGDCVWKYACRGACRAKAYEDGGDFFAPFPICQQAADAGTFPDVYRISKGGCVDRSAVLMQGVEG